MTAQRITGLYAVAVPVRDQDRALAFYVEALGLEPRRDVPVAEVGGRWIEVAPVGAAAAIALVPERAGRSAGIDTGIRLTAADAAAARARLLARGVDVGELGGCSNAPPTFDLRDEDGNLLQIVEER